MEIPFVAAYGVRIVSQFFHNMVLKRFKRFAEIVFRAILVLFIDLVLSRRISWIYTFAQKYISSLSIEGYLYPKELAGDLIGFGIAIVFSLCLVASVLYPRDNAVFALACTPFFLVFAIYLALLRRLDMLVSDPEMWNWRIIASSVFPLPILSYLIALICFKFLPSTDEDDNDASDDIEQPPTQPKLNDALKMLRNAIRLPIFAAMLALPIFLYVSAHKLADSVYALAYSPAESCFPDWKQPISCKASCGYFRIMIPSHRTLLTEPVWQAYSYCLIPRSSANLIMAEIKSFPELFVAIYFCLILIAYTTEGVWARIVRRVDEQWRLITTDPFEYIVYHWSRLDVPRIFLTFWIIKLIAVVCMGEAFWPVDSTVVELVSRANEINETPVRYSLNFTFLCAYSKENMMESSSTFAKYQSRLLTGVLAIGSETWTSVYGAAVFLGLLSGILVKILAFFVDPLGETTAQLIQTAEAEPVAANPWAPIEDQLFNNEHIEVTAVELLSNTGWSCVVLFVFLAIQYDLPNLSIHQRVFCFMHLFIVMGFTCVYPVESLVKAILLRLGIPGQDSTWLDHLIPLIFCGLMLGVAGCVFVYFPAWLSHLPHTGRGYQFLDGGLNHTAAKAPAVFSAYSSYAQRLRTYLCGGQLLLDVICTLIEYVLHQLHRRKPQWSGFSTLLAITRLTNIFINYLISLLSVFIILWLIFYEAFGVCRVFILVVHVTCVLYPATYRGLSWLRWRLISARSLSKLQSPTTAELVANADDCPICYSVMTVINSKLTRCGHLYHTDCLTQWMRRQTSCPLCASDLFSTSVKSTRVLAPNNDDQHPQILPDP